MKCLGEGTSVHILSSVKRSIFLSAKHSKARTPISKRLSRFSALSASITLGVLLAALTLSASLFARGSSVAAFSESITTFASDCATPKADWNLGQTACAQVSGAPDQRRIIWVAPNGATARVSPSFSGSANDSYTFDTTGSLAQVGTWSVVSIDNAGAGFAIAKFVVHNSDPNLFSADISVGIFGPSQVSPNSNATYVVEVGNHGPDAAQGVTLTVPTPANTTFVSSDCASLSGTTCTIGSLNSGATASVTYVFHVSSGATQGSFITSTATVSSSTNDPVQSNNAATHNVAVVVETPTSPCIISCPADKSVNNDPNAANPCVATVTYSPATISGNCVDPDTGQTASVVCSPASGSAFPVGTNTVTCSAGGALCNFTVKVVDTRTTPAVTISCPSNVTASEESPGAGSAVVNYPAPSATGNCVRVTCSPASGTSFPVGTTTVNCTATDFAEPAHTDSCSFTVTVTSATQCTLTCPVNITKNNDPGDCGAVVTYAAPTTQGSCGTVSCDPPSNSFFPIGTTTVTCTATDAGGSTITTCSFNVTVNDTNTLTCPANITTPENPTGSGQAPVNYQEPTACSGATVTCNPPSGSSFPVGTTTVTCTSSSGPTCSFTVTVTTGAPCVITCPANQTVNNAPNQCGAVVTYPAPTTSGNCGSDPPNCNPPSGSFFPVGASTVTCITTVGTQCAFTVTVNDTQPPVIGSCPGNITESNDPGQCSAVVTYTTPTVSDNCPGATVSCSPASGSAFPKGTTTVTCTAHDASNNTASCQFTVTVNDNEKPTISCPANITTGNDPGLCSAVVSFSPTVSDNCPGATANCSPASGSTFPKGTTTVTCSATDTSGNTSATTCSFTVTVNDTENPTISCPSPITRSTDPNVCSAVVSFSPTANDNCPGVTSSCSPPSGSTFPKGTTTVTCTATDTSSHTASCSFTVTVNDTQPPAISCPANIVEEPTCPAGAKATFAPVVSDNCPGVTFVCSPASGSTFAFGTTTVTCTATDAAPSNNTAQCSFTVKVKTPAEVIQDLINRVQALMNQGVLNQNQGQGLVNTLQQALDALNAGSTSGACGKLTLFINKVQNFIQNGTLTAAQGQPLIDSANRVINTLGCTNNACT